MTEIIAGVVTNWSREVTFSAAEAVDSATEKVKSGASVTFSEAEKVKSEAEKTNSGPPATFSRHEMVNSVTEAGFGGTVKINSEREASFCPLASLPETGWRRLAVWHRVSSATGENTIW